MKIELASVDPLQYHSPPRESCLLRGYLGVVIASVPIDAHQPKGEAAMYRALRRIVFFLFLSSFISSELEAQITAVRAGRLIDPETGAAALNQVILVEGETIRAVGADVTIPEGATVVDLSDLSFKL